VFKIWDKIYKNWVKKSNYLYSIKIFQNFLKIIHNLKIGSNLIVKKGITETEIAKLADHFNINIVYYHDEVCFEEKSIENSLISNLKKIG